MQSAVYKTLSKTLTFWNCVKCENRCSGADSQHWSVLVLFHWDVRTLPTFFRLDLSTQLLRLRVATDSQAERPALPSGVESDRPHRHIQVLPMLRWRRTLPSNPARFATPLPIHEAGKSSHHVCILWLQSFWRTISLKSCSCAAPLNLLRTQLIKRNVPFTNWCFYNFLKLPLWTANIFNWNISYLNQNHKQERHANLPHV